MSFHKMYVKVEEGIPDILKCWQYVGKEALYLLFELDWSGLAHLTCISDLILDWDDFLRHTERETATIDGEEYFVVYINNDMHFIQALMGINAYCVFEEEINAVREWLKDWTPKWYFAKDVSSTFRESDFLLPEKRTLDAHFNKHSTARWLIDSLDNDECAVLICSKTFVMGQIRDGYPTPRPKWFEKTVVRQIPALGLHNYNSKPIFQNQGDLVYKLSQVEKDGKWQFTIEVYWK